MKIRISSFLRSELTQQALNFTNNLRQKVAHTVKQKRSRGISLSKESFENEPDYQEIPEVLILNLLSTRI